MKTFSVLLIVFWATTLPAQTPEIGIVENLEQDSLFHAAGYKYLSESISKCFSPKNLTDAQFEERLKMYAQLQPPIVACNYFIPGDLKLVGPNVDEEAVLKYVEVVFQRYQKAGLKMIVWGFGNSLI